MVAFLQVVVSHFFLENKFTLDLNRLERSRQDILHFESADVVRFEGNCDQILLKRKGKTADF
jgi:hypothetical protein